MREPGEGIPTSRLPPSVGLMGRKRVRERRGPVMAGELPWSRCLTAGDPHGRGIIFPRGIPGDFPWAAEGITLGSLARV